MSVKFKTPTDVATEYLVYLKGLKPEVNTDQTDSDWWIRSRVVGGVVAGVYADQRKIADDAFPQFARHDALSRHLDLYFGRDFNPATPAEGTVSVTGSIGTIYTIGTEFQYQPNGNVYQATEIVTLTGTTGAVTVQSVADGQNQNLLAGAALVLTSPPPGSQSNAVALTNISDGTNEESDTAAAAKILNRVQQPPAGGNANDYRNWALQADPSVIDANIIRFIFGPGTVGVVVIAGTTDIDGALNNDIPIIRQPSQQLIDKVDAYTDALNPLTDCLFVLGPTDVSIDVTVKVRFVDGDQNTIPSTQLTNTDGTLQTLTQGELVIREVQRAIYKTPPGGRQFNGSGFVVASEIEQVIDDNLSAEPYNSGIISSILSDRQVEDLSASGSNRMILPNELAVPGTITLVVMD